MTPKDAYICSIHGCIAVNVSFRLVVSWGGDASNVIATWNRRAV